MKLKVWIKCAITLILCFICVVAEILIIDNKLIESSIAVILGFVSGSVMWYIIETEEEK